MATRDSSQATRKQNDYLMDDVGIRYCKVSPSFLKTNAKSHTWAFSAVAELIDNAYDPGVRATQIRIDQRNINGESCLVFIDDGNGLSEDQLYRMLSFGYSDKAEHADYKPIGQYGNGFKSGSMRLGKDALVLTKRKDTVSIGFLSQTFHECTNADTVRIPIVVFDRQTLQLAEPLLQNEANLLAILDHSIFKTVDELIDQLTVVPDFDQDRSCGTKVIIWNLRQLGHGTPELYFRPDTHDVVCHDSDCSSGPLVTECQSNDLGYKQSLRKYCGILYLRPRMKIFIMGEKVRSRLITKDLCQTETDRYKMNGERPITITLGFTPTMVGVDYTNDYGVMMYHKNRLVTPFEKVACQKQSNGSGRGVVCVIEADFLTPNPNKQGFAMDEKYHRMVNAVGRKLSDYWDVKLNLTAPIEGIMQPDCYQVQCSICSKWRVLLDGASEMDLVGDWFCAMHPNEEVNQDCQAAQDQLDQGEVDSVYRQEKALLGKRKKTSSSGFRTGRDEAPQDDERETRRKRQRTDTPPPPLLSKKKPTPSLVRMERIIYDEPRSAFVDDVTEELRQGETPTMDHAGSSPSANNDDSNGDEPGTSGMATSRTPSTRQSSSSASLLDAGEKEARTTVVITEALANGDSDQETDDEDASIQVSEYPSDDYPSELKEDEDTAAIQHVKAAKRKKTQSSRAGRDNYERETWTASRAALATDANKKANELGRQVQSLMTEPPIVVSTVADEVHNNRRRDNNESRTVFCLDKSQSQCPNRDNARLIDNMADGNDEPGAFDMASNRAPVTRKPSSPACVMDADEQEAATTVEITEEPVNGDSDQDTDDEDNETVQVAPPLIQVIRVFKPVMRKSSTQTEAVIVISEDEHAQHEAESAQIQADRDQIQAERDQIQADRDQIQAERDQIQADRDQIQAERTQFVAERDQFVAERDQFVAERDQFVAERTQFVAERTQFVAERDQFVAERDQFVAERDQFVAERARFQAERAQYEVQIDRLRAYHAPRQ